MARITRIYTAFMLYEDIAKRIIHAAQDMIVEDVIIVELKAVADLRSEHEWQLINYLTACHKE